MRLLFLEGGGELGPEHGAHLHSATVAFKIEFFVGGVGVVIGQGQAEEQGVHSQDFSNLVDDGDGSTFTQKDWVMAESSL